MSVTFIAVVIIHKLEQEEKGDKTYANRCREIILVNSLQGHLFASGPLKSQLHFPAHTTGITNRYQPRLHTLIILECHSVIQNKYLDFVKYTN